MTLLGFSLALMLASQRDMAEAPIVFPSASTAFERGILACEAIYAGALRGEKSDPSKPGPMSQRGFYMSGAGDEAKVNTLMVGRRAQVFKGAVNGSAGVVYVVLSTSPLACRVGSFDAEGSEASALKRLSDRNSGWIALPTTSPTPAAKMQRYQKSIAGATATLNISWPSERKTGPKGLAAMATMIVGGGATPPTR